MASVLYNILYNIIPILVLNTYKLYLFLPFIFIYFYSYSGVDFVTLQIEKRKNKLQNYFSTSLLLCASRPTLSIFTPDDAVPASAMPDLLLVPQLSAAAIGGFAGATVQRNRRPQG